MQRISQVETVFFHRFKTPIDGIPLPERFTFPFFYEPHPLCEIAARELQEVIERASWEREFGAEAASEVEGKGKMFGVLLIQNASGEVGYLAAFSGKLENAPHGFVPFVYSLPDEDNFYTKGMHFLAELGEKIRAARSLPQMAESLKQLETVKASADVEITEIRREMRLAKAERKAERIEGKKSLNKEAYSVLESRLSFESQKSKYKLKALLAKWREELEEADKKYAAFKKRIQNLVDERARFSADLQKQLFDKYCFLNQAGKVKSLTEIFDKGEQPPSGAGDCAAPKLLQYAFANKLKPLAMAEFWWGKSPATVIRQHKKYYPACKNKCRPILAHMLKGMALDANPLLLDYGIGKPLETVYEDEYIVVVNKPFGLLSVPGKEITDSVSTRLREKYPQATGPLLLHRLDQDTSGLLLAAKSEQVHKKLQAQFLKRTVQKRYVALLESECASKEGDIDLPLRVDLDNRPNQMVCYDHGKQAITHYKVVSVEGGKTRIHLFPHTGRTHQLRVHVAHPLGLNNPIVGDILYGANSDRMYLHAEFLEFIHPVSREKVSVEAKAGF